MDLLREAELLRKVPMFSRLDSAKLKLLAFTSECLSFEDGEVLFEAGDPADSAYVIMEGEAEVIADTGSGAVVEATMGMNERFGEMAAEFLGIGGLRTRNQDQFADAIALSLGCPGKPRQRDRQAQRKRGT